MITSTQICSEGYIEALYKAVTLGDSLVRAYQADVREVLTQGGGTPPLATLHALGASDTERPTGTPQAIPQQLAVAHSLGETGVSSLPLPTAPFQRYGPLSLDRQRNGGDDGELNEPDCVLRDRFLRKVRFGPFPVSAPHGTNTGWAELLLSVHPALGCRC